MPATGTATLALLELDEVRIETDSGLLVDGITCRGEGQRLALVGPWDGWFQLLGGSARLTNGAARIQGNPAPEAVATGRVGVALQDVPFPRRWTGLDYLVQSAKLSGFGSLSEGRARAVVEQLGLSRLVGRRLEVMAPAERRATLLAHAVLTDPPTLVLEAPLDELDAASAARLAEVVERAATGRSLIASVRDPAIAGPGRGLIDAADAVLELGPRGEVAVVRGDPLRSSAGRQYVVAVPRQAAEFAVELERRGVHVERFGAGHHSTAAVSRSELSDHAARFLVRVAPEAGTDAILDASLALDVPVVHLAPSGLTLRGQPDTERS